MTAALAALPPLTWLFASLAGCPAGTVAAPRRLAAIRGALVTGAVGVAATEGLTLVHQVTGPALLAVWTVATAGSAAAAGYRHRRVLRVGPARPRRPRVPVPPWPELVLIGGVLLVVLAELVIALVSPANNADSQGYHLSRIENWVQDRSVDFYPTAAHRQVGLSPGAEYLLLQLRLLAGPEEFYNLLQWAAGLGLVLVVSRIAAQLGAGRRGQLLAAVTVATTPLVVLEATSTQTDLVAAFWVCAGASLALAGPRRTAGGWAGATAAPGGPDRPAAAVLGQAVWLGLAAGLAAVTKLNGLATLAPFLVLWGVRWLAPVRADRTGLARLGRTAAGTAVVLLLAAALVGPFTLRGQREWGTLGGDPGAQAVALGRHDPAAVGVNALRIAATVTVPRVGSSRARAQHALDHLAAALHLSATDGRLTFLALPFDLSLPPFPDEDHSPYPLQALAVLGAIGYALAGRHRPGPVRGYAAASGFALLATAAAVAWQPWINRLILPTFAVATPLVGWACGDLLSRAAVAARPGRGWVRPALAGALALAVPVAGLGAATALWSGQPRPLGTGNSVLTAPRDRTRYARDPTRQVPYQAAAAQVAAARPARIGLVQTNTGWEYVWWEQVRRDGLAPVLVSLTSALPKQAPLAVSTVDAVICALPPPLCAPWLPAGWSLTQYGEAADAVSVMLPAATAPR